MLCACLWQVPVLGQTEKVLRAVRQRQEAMVAKKYDDALQHFQQALSLWLVYRHAQNKKVEILHYIAIAYGNNSRLRQT
jgi:hypothetical protein